MSCATFAAMPRFALDDAHMFEVLSINQLRAMSADQADRLPRQ